MHAWRHASMPMHPVLCCPSMAHPCRLRLHQLPQHGASVPTAPMPSPPPPLLQRHRGAGGPRQDGRQRRAQGTQGGLSSACCCAEHPSSGSGWLSLAVLLPGAPLIRIWLARHGYPLGARHDGRQQRRVRGQTRCCSVVAQLPGPAPFRVLHLSCAGEGGRPRHLLQVCR